MATWKTMYDTIGSGRPAGAVGLLGPAAASPPCPGLFTMLAHSGWKARQYISRSPKHRGVNMPPNARYPVVKSQQQACQRGAAPYQ